MPPASAVPPADEPLTDSLDQLDQLPPEESVSVALGADLARPRETNRRPPADATAQSPAARDDLPAGPTMDNNAAATQRSVPAAQSEPKPPQRPEVLVVGDYDPQSPWDKGQFCANLQAACRRAMISPAVKTIELRYDGYRQESESPFTLANPRLTIRAAEGYVPMVRFQPDLATLAMSSFSMIRIVGGRLRIEGVQFELDVPAEPELRCQLFQLEQVEELELERCFVTIRDCAAVPGSYAGSNAFLQRERAAAIDLQVPPGSESMMDQADGSLDAWSVINLLNCVIRGEATVVRALQAVPFRLKWANGLLATSSRMLSIGAARSDPEQQQSHIRVDLQHVTAVVQQGLCRVQADDDALGFIMTTDLNCSQCIFVTGPDVPLIEHIATVESDPAELDSLLLFSGERNFYENVKICWSRKVRVRHLDDQQQEDQLDAEDWKSREKLAKWDKVQWRRRPPGDQRPDAPAHARRLLPGEPTGQPRRRVRRGP